MWDRRIKLSQHIQHQIIRSQKKRPARRKRREKNCSHSLKVDRTLSLLLYCAIFTNNKFHTSSLSCVSPRTPKLLCCRHIRKSERFFSLQNLYTFFAIAPFMPPQQTLLSTNTFFFILNRPNFYLIPGVVSPVLVASSSITAQTYITHRKCWNY